MREEHGSALRAFRQRSDIGLAPRPEADSDEIERLAVDRHAGPRILQHLDAHPCELRGHVVIVVVVAENSEYPVPRLDARQAFGRWANELTVAPRHVIATEDDEIRPLVHERRDGLGDIVMRDPAASVD